MEKKNKELVPTNLGMTFINLVHSSLTQPDTTAEIKYLLSEITEGKGNMDDFDTKIKESVLKNIDFADTIVFPQEPDSLETKCSFCNEGLIVRCYSKKSERHFHVCNNTLCRHPITEKIVY
jgi:hypothetical protein